MTDRIVLNHRIERCFDRRVNLSTHWLRLRPAPHAPGPITAYSLRVETQPHFLNWVRDPFENHLTRLDFPEPAARVAMEMEFIADLKPRNPFDFVLEPFASNYPFDYPEQLSKELTPYLRLESVGARLADWFSKLDRSPAYIVDRLAAVNQAVHRRLHASQPVAPGPVDLEAVLDHSSASAWELAWLLTLSLRSLGLAARFTSGYLITLSATGPDAFGVLHAWSEVYVPGAGWIGVDPASVLFTAQTHIPLASAPDPLRAVPIVGYREACEETATDRITVRRLMPASISSPYTESQWAEMQALGRRIDQDLAERRIALSLGSGLSFVSAHDRGAPEWNTMALGSTKRPVAEKFMRRLAARLAPGGVLHVGQGGWYGGEPLPRWCLGCFFRKDGHPVWKNPGLQGLNNSTDHPGTGRDAKRFAQSLAHVLGVSIESWIPAFEDGLYELWSHRTFVDSMPSGEDLTDPDRRRSLAIRLSATQHEAVGHVLPLRWDSRRNGWVSGRWRFRREGIFLMPGSSSMGYRLPLDGLAAGEGNLTEVDPERCPFEDRPLLPDVHGELSARMTKVSGIGASLECADEEPTISPTPRTAVCIEIREGRLYVFLPPLTHLEHYLDLVAAVESAAQVLLCPVILEGYAPPEDHRLARISIEPDAGIIKVGLPESLAWEEQLRYLDAAYEEAAQLGLRGERIAANGRRHPPGGRAEIVLGGERPADSPFLRRPELVRALVSYWQAHPSLSYFFAGRAIGAGSDAPRPDEGRADALYELSIALERIPSGDIAFPWVPDRLLRHLLADPAGDMRRAELCIDQLYAPERASLRLGRVILRSFETPPDSRTAALQSLLVVGLLTYFSREPRMERFRPWNSTLHDRFLLPRLLWEDLLVVLLDLQAAGYPFQAAWFEPILELRFPVIGRIQLGDMALELRRAHEPWPILAEEVAGGGLVRFVDSAHERLQVCLSGAAPSRYALVCNGHRVPLQGTDVAGEQVAGVRYKVGNPPSTLHPTIRPVSALVFDLIDTWTGRAVGGCTYHPPGPGVWGPAAVSQAPEVPVADTSRERLLLPPMVAVPPWSTDGRFVPAGSGPGPMAPPAESFDVHSPYSLDLTRLSLPS